MKKLLLLLLFTTPVFARSGVHNGIISLGVGVAAGNMMSGSGLHYELNFGYIYHGIKGKTINAADLRLSLDGSYYNESQSVGYFNSVKYNAQYTKILGGFLFTYSVGRVLPNARLMFDIIGFGYSAGIHSLKNTFDPSLIISSSAFFERFRVPIPLGITAYFNNGAVFGFRHIMTIGGGISLEYTLTFHLGYIFGK